MQILNAVDTPFETFDVLGDQAVRAGIKEYSNWPTIPQVRKGGAVPVRSNDLARG